MASLKSLLQQKLPFIAFEEDMLEQGMVHFFTPSNVRTKLPYDVCWRAPADGVVQLEIWGAGGSGAKMCCCGGGIPGNPGAYSKKTICMTAGQLITGSMGYSCGNSNDLCFRGCSEATGLCWSGCAVSDGSTNGCMCAQGGRGGTSYCSTGTSLYCCFAAAGFCVTRTNGDNCGIVCNYGTATGSCCADAYGGDVNLRGGFSRASFFGCYPMCPCQFFWHLATPPGYGAICGGEVTYTNETDSGLNNWSGSSLPGFKNGLGLIGKQPYQGVDGEHNCWTGGRTCGCYDGQGCVPFVPVGHPGPPPLPCPQVRDHAFRGGHGGLRIKFIKSE
jgi:hypothetical protein